MAVQIISHNLARWTTRIGLGEPVATTKTLRRRFLSLAGRITRKARKLDPARLNPSFPKMATSFRWIWG
jgi:hypothetical protein